MHRPALNTANIGTRLGVWMYRRFNGRYLARKGETVLMITSPGRVSGLPRSACVRYLDTPDGYLVWGTAAGKPRDPDWFRNLRHTTVAEVQVMTERRQVEPRELLGAERDEAWNNVILARAPEVARYAAMAGRTIPVAVLKPL